jgi:hypothetical protein
MSLSLLIALLVILKPPHTDSAKGFLLPSVLPRSGLNIQNERSLGRVAYRPLDVCGHQIS